MRNLKDLRQVIVPLLCAALIGGGCAAKKSLDKNVKRFIAALQKSDYDDFKKMSADSLTSEVPKATFLRLCAALKRLGKYEGKSMRGITMRDGLHEGRYKVSFAKGNIQLRITMKGNKLVGYKISGDPFVKAMKSIVNQEFKRFEVAKFEFTDGAGQARASNIHPVGSMIHFRFQVRGLQRKAKTLAVQVDLQVAASVGGQVVMTKPKLVDQSVPNAPAAPPIARVTGKFSTGKQAGAFTLRFRITDKHSGKTLMHEQAMVLK